MSKQLHISGDVALPVELTTRRSAIFGISGSGKSNTAAVCIEQLLAAGEQVVLIDPKGEGWGLQTSADGRKAGFDVIVFGQPRGDIPELREEHAEQVADFVVDSARSVVLSLLGFDSDESERRFVTRFFQRLYRRKSQQAAKSRTLIVLEEAHLFVPEHGTGAVAGMVGAIKRIARQGRSAGLGLMIIDQRPQEVAKSIISQCELLVCHQLVHKLDRDALREWVRAYDREGQGEMFLDSLAGLQPGEAWVWSPAWLGVFKRTKVRRRTTYDSGATPDGSPAAAPKAKAKVDLDALREHLAKVVEQAKASDPRLLKAELARVRAELAKAQAAKPAPAPPPAKERRVEVPVLKDGQLDRLDGFASKLAELYTRVAALQDQLAEMAGQVTAAARSTVQPVVQRPVQPTARMVAPAPAAARPAPRPRPYGDASADGPLPRGERAVLTACAQYPGGATREQLTVLAGYKRSSRDAYVGRLKDRGFVQLDGDKIIATDAGVAALGDDFQPLPEGDALREWWMNRLPEGERRILEHLISKFPASVPRVDLEETGYRRSSRDAYLQRLSARRLVEVVGRSEVRASSLLFD